MSFFFLSCQICRCRVIKGNGLAVADSWALIYANLCWNLSLIISCQAMRYLYSHWLIERQSLLGNIYLHIGMHVSISYNNIIGSSVFSWSRGSLICGSKHIVKCCWPQSCAAYKAGCARGGADGCIVWVTQFQHYFYCLILFFGGALSNAHNGSPSQMVAQLHYESVTNFLYESSLTIGKPGNSAW